MLFEPNFKRIIRRVLDIGGNIVPDFYSLKPNTFLHPITGVARYMQTVSSRLCRSSRPICL